MWISLALYVLVAPLSTYNTFALIWSRSSHYAGLQLAITAVMIVFAIVAGRPIGQHCAANTSSRIKRWLWTAGFYVIGPPVLYIYYRVNGLKAV